MHDLVASATRFAAALALLLAVANGPALAQADDEHRAPLHLADQGSFFVNGQTITTDYPRADTTREPGRIVVRQMYVQYRIPAQRLRDGKRAAYPVVMVHGSGHTGKTYETTPDGREGWATYFVRRGIPTYVVDQVARARSSFDPTSVNQARAESNPELIPERGLRRFTYEVAWDIFRFGPEPDVFYPTTQFPTEALDQYMAQTVPNTDETIPSDSLVEVQANALATLLDTIGPAIVMVHSQSGPYGMRVAELRPELVKGLINIEGRCPVTEGTLETAWRQVPLLTVFGDFLAESELWTEIANECQETVRSINGAGGRARQLVLPEQGIRGNSHMLMLDENNRRIADWLIGWIRRNVR